MSKMVMIEHVSGSVVSTQYINLDYVVEYNPKSRRLICCYGDKGQRTFILTESYSEKLESMLSQGVGTDAMELLLQQQRDLNAYKTFFINVVGWCRGQFREGRAIPALGLFNDVSGEVNSELDMMMDSLRKLNDEYLEMQEQLKQLSEKPVDGEGDPKPEGDDNHGVDPDKQ